ncbi:hypothetical protein ROHU_008547 [Labeo rohita]|uniref:Uncharacterized protein n=1 Tax=Labeo rohita TaxID=84645 RepID=A0A498L6M8_LABRO|nr:hypothetical protein ROHU_013113 [Labeo rohita]RXN15925.1 hypothetical protein ROHU_008547 [Labeo rohita]
MVHELTLLFLPLFPQTPHERLVPTAWIHFIGVTAQPCTHPSPATITGKHEEGRGFTEHRRRRLHTYPYTCNINYSNSTESRHCTKISESRTGTGRSRNGGYPTTVVLDESGIQDEPPGDPRTLLWTVAFPIDKVLGATAAGSRDKDPPDSVRRSTVDDPDQGWSSDLGKQRGEEDMFKLRLVEYRMDPEGSRQLEPEGDRV